MTWDCATLKYNSSGIMKWAQRLTGGGRYSLAIYKSGDVYVGGAPVSANWDFALIKLLMQRK